MDIKRFWSIIDKGRVCNRDLDECYNILLHELAGLEGPQLITWANILDQYMQSCDKSMLKAAASIINAGYRGESFKNFCGWLISRGKDVFFAALHDPDSLAEIDGVLESETEFGEIQQLAMSIFREKSGDVQWGLEEFNSQLSKNPLTASMVEEINEGIVYNPKIDATWSNSTLPELLPRLCEKFEFTP